jgi:hypothetical protein
VKLEAATPPTRTTAPEPLTKPDPVTVMSVPPATGPDAGLTDVTTGAVLV